MAKAAKTMIRGRNVKMDEIPVARQMIMDSIPNLSQSMSARPVTARDVYEEMGSPLDASASMLDMEW